MATQLQKYADQFNSLAPAMGENFFKVEDEKIIARDIPIPAGLLVPAKIHTYVAEQGIPVTKIYTGQGNIEILFDHTAL